jgi:tRNA(His) 5'-end guanylyltransferase
MIKLGRTWKKVVVAYSKVLFQYFPDRTEENHKNVVYSLSFVMEEPRTTSRRTEDLFPR